MDVLRLELELAVAAALGLRFGEFLAWSESDRDKAIWQHIRPWGAYPVEWDPDKGEQET